MRRPHKTVLNLNELKNEEAVANATASFFSYLVFSSLLPEFRGKPKV